MGYKHADLLNYAKNSNLIIAKGENVRNAKKFSDLTPTKQKIVRDEYKKFIAKQKKKAPGTIIDLEREFTPRNVNSNNLVKPAGLKKGEKFKVKTDAGYSSLHSPYVKTAIYQSATLFTTDAEGVTFKKFTAKEKKNPQFSKRGEDQETKKHLLPIAEWYLDAEKGSKAYKEASEMSNNPIYRKRFTIDYINKRIIQVL